MASFQAGQVLTASLLNFKTQNLVARGRRTSTSSNSSSTALLPVLRVDDVPIKAGVSYQVTARTQLNIATSGERMRMVLKYTVDGSTPLTSSNTLVGSGAAVTFPTSSATESLQSTTDYVPAQDELLSVLLCIYHDFGTSNSASVADGVTFTTDIWIRRQGDDPGNSGTAL